jgi:hypothetical protein
LQYDYSKAMTNSAAQFGQLNANYMSQIGLAGLGYQDSSTQGITNTANRELDWMNSVSVPYPDPYAYAAMNEKAGAVSAGSGSYKMPPMNSGYAGASTGGASPKNPMNSSFGNQGSYYTTSSGGGTPGYYGTPQTGGSQTLYPSSGYEEIPIVGPMMDAANMPYDTQKTYQSSETYDYSSGEMQGASSGYDEGWY